MEYVLALNKQNFSKYFEYIDKVQLKEGVSISTSSLYWILIWKSASPSFCLVSISFIKAPL